MKLKSTFETHVYLSDAGYICIAQKVDIPGVEDPCVTLSHEQAALVARELTRLSNRTSWDPIDTTDELPEPGED